MTDATDPDPAIRPTDHELRLQGRGTSLRRLPSVLADAIRLVREAGGRTFTSVVVLQLAAALVAALEVIAAKLVLDHVVGEDGDAGRAIRDALPALALLGGAIAVSAVLVTSSLQRRRLLSELVVRRSQQRLIDITLGVDVLDFERPAFFDRLRRVEAEASLSRSWTMVQGILSLLNGGFGLVAIGLTLAAMHPLLPPALIIAALPLLLVSGRVSRLEFAFMVEQSPAIREREYLRSVLTAKDTAQEERAYGFGPALRERYDAHYESFVADLRRHLARRTRLGLISAVAFTLLAGLAFAVLFLLIDHGRVSLAEAGAAAIAVRLLMTRMQGLLAGVGQVLESALFLDDLTSFATSTSGVTVTRREPPNSPRPSGGAVPPRIEVDRVSFTYPGGGRPALDDVSLSIGPGQVVALVGENGSGKTTLAKLLAGLYRPTVGSVRRDGRIVDPDDPAVRAATAVVFQDFVHYELSGADNVGLGDPAHLDDRGAIEKAARKGGIHDTLAGLPRGYDTVLSTAFAGGHDLSVGQWQRLAIARAFFRDSPLVVLDEPSAALDPRAERELFDRVRTLLARRTVVVISHRFSTVRSADRIHVMTGGHIVEAGNHDELMAEGGLYAELFTLQAAAYTTDPTGA